MRTTIVIKTSEKAKEKHKTLIHVFYALMINIEVLLFSNVAQLHKHCSIELGISPDLTPMLKAWTRACSHSHTHKHTPTHTLTHTGWLDVSLFHTTTPELFSSFASSDRQTHTPALIMSSLWCRHLASRL